MSLRAALLVSALPTLAAAQDIDTGEIHACMASCLADRSTVEFIQYSQCIADLCASLATGTGAAEEMAAEMTEAADEGADDSGIQNETLLILGDEAEEAEAEEPTPQPVVSANAGINLDAPAEGNTAGDSTMNAVPVPVEVDETPAEVSDDTDGEMTADMAETPAVDTDAPEQAGDGGDTAMNADIAESPDEDGAEDMANAEDATEDMTGATAMADDGMVEDDAEEAVADTMADDAGSPDVMADDAASPDMMADDAMAEDAMSDVAMAEDSMAEEATSDATNQIITGDAAPEPVEDPVSSAEWQLFTLSASEAPWVDGFGALVSGEHAVQFGYLCARSGVSHLTLIGDSVTAQPGVYTVVIGQGQYLTPPMVSTGDRLQAGISPNDPLLGALRAGSVADVYGPDRALVSRFELRGSSAAITTALESCF